ncbi:MAG: UDP-N-acetylglucosamine 2-epimerase, partial [Planctomycetota bacterium]|nr:UDP-N-acetylglucosamine 2-epimerase [Planctomycetota bacterium]
MVPREAGRRDGRRLSVWRTKASGGGPASSGPWVAVAGTRPNYVKLAPLIRAAEAAGRELMWIDTGQHSHDALHAGMVADLALPEPLHLLPTLAPGPTRIPQLAAELVKLLASLSPSVVLVLGDVDSTVAAARAAWRLDLPLAHVEAGLRCFEASMPEERNRVLVDALADRFYPSEPGAVELLRAEDVALEHIGPVGNVMADALRAALPTLRALPRGGGVEAGAYAVATLHRQANVDDDTRLARYVEALSEVARTQPVLWPLHPRVSARRRLPADLAARGVHVLPPRPYLSFLALVARSRVVVTDSGGLQLEAALLGVPCVVARAVTEHALCVQAGGTVLAGP